MVIKKREEKPEDLETRVDKQLGLIGEEKEMAPVIKGPFTCFIKGNDGKIKPVYARSWWRLIFVLALEISTNYSTQFQQGIVFKVVRAEEPKT